jgi:hypothetical protein
MLISNGLQPIPVARLLGSWVRIPLRARIFVSCVCCVRNGHCDELITRYRSYTARARVCVCVCVCVCVRARVWARNVITSKIGRPRSDLARSAIENNGQLARTTKMFLRIRGVKVWIHIFLGIRWLHCKFISWSLPSKVTCTAITRHQTHIRHKFLTRSVHPIQIYITYNDFSAYGEPNTKAKFLCRCLQHNVALQHVVFRLFTLSSVTIIPPTFCIQHCINIHSTQHNFNDGQRR